MHKGKYKVKTKVKTFLLILVIVLLLSAASCKIEDIIRSGADQPENCSAERSEVAIEIPESVTEDVLSPESLFPPTAVLPPPTFLSDGLEETTDATEELCKDKVPGYDKYKPIVAEALGYDVSNAQFIAAQQVETGYMAPGTVATAIVFELYSDGISHWNPKAIVIEGDGVAFCHVLEAEGIGMFTEFSLADIDGDGFDEILTLSDLLGSGGMGSHEARIYKFDGSKLYLLYSHCDNIDENGYHYDDGFILELFDGWTHIVSNRYTDLSCTFIYKRPGENAYFDEVGSVTSDGEEHNACNAPATDAYFFIFEPVDIDNDGIYEIMTVQYSSLGSRADSLGFACLIHKWNSDSKTLEIVKAGFLHEVGANIYWLARLRDYLDNWCKG